MGGRGGSEAVDGAVDGPVEPFDVVVVGAGLAGLYALHRLRGLGLSVVVIEAGDDVGGTWYWNRYPGARCDVESADYSYSFSPELEQEWTWTERFAAQPEILAYLQHVADRFDLRRDMRFGHRVTSVHLDEASVRWTVGLDDGTALSARYVVMATGCLSIPKDVDIDGLDSFAGTVLRTSSWPRDEPDLDGLRIGVIGTGSSGIQCVPELAKRAARLTVFQRTANFSVPAQNHPMSPEAVAELKATYRERRELARNSWAGVVITGTGKSVWEVTEEERTAEYDRRWAKGGVQFLGGFTDTRTDVEANDTIAEYVRDRIREQVADPDVAAKLLPSGYPIGTRRLCVDTGYYPTFNLPHVDLVDLRATPIERITPSGVRTTAGEIPLDVLVLATGFDAMTGALTKIDIRGRGNELLADRWRDGPRNYLGIGVSGFPNLFTVTGPGSPAVLANMVMSIEQHIDWIADCIEHLVATGARSIEATPAAEDEWMEHVRGVAELTLFPMTDSWYVGTNVPGKPRVFLPYLGGFDAYTAKCNEVAAAGYAGFVIDRTEEEPMVQLGVAG